MPCAGSPEAQGKAELLMAVISSINKWQGYTVGASRAISHVAGSLSKHRRIIHEASGACTASSCRLRLLQPIVMQVQDERLLLR